MNRILLMVLKNLRIVPGAYMKLCHYAKHGEKYSVEEKYRHVQYIFKRAVEGGNIDFRVYGKENFPKEDGFVICGNHQGMFDFMAVAASCEKPISIIFKKELANIPFLKQAIACTDSLAMDRENIRQSMEVILEMIKEIKKGRNYLIFPEGTRSKNGNETNEFHGGSFKCATKTKCPILPVALIDCYKVLDRKGCKPMKVQVHYLEPIYYEEYKDMNTTEIAAMVRARIAEVIRAKQGNCNILSC